MTAKCAILVDFDNVFSTLWELDRKVAMRFANDPGDWLQLLANTHLSGDPRRWLVARCYLNPAGYAHAPEEGNARLYYSRFRPGLVRAGFEVIDCPAVSRGGKNAADIRMVVDILDLLNHRTHFDEFVLASGDSDFTPLLQRLRAEDRRITIVSPGYLSSAYTSMADRIIGFEAMADLLTDDLLECGEPEAGGDRSDASEAGSSGVGYQSAATSPAYADHWAANIAESRALFASFIQQRYEEANAPLNLAALAFEAARHCAGAKQSGWFAGGSFLSAVSALNLPHVRFSQHQMWDEERHQPPAIDGSNHSIDLPEPVDLLARELDLPRLGKEDWPKVFRAIADYAQQHEFNLTEATRHCRDALAAEGVKVARNAVAYVMRGAKFGGARLEPEHAPTPKDVGRAFVAAVLDRAASLGQALHPDTEKAVSDWMGVEISAS